MFRQKNVDTLAYVINYTNDNGFVVVSADYRVPSILAFSDSGNFSYKPEESNIVYCSFVRKLQYYMDNLSERNPLHETSSYAPRPPFLYRPPCLAINNMGQDEPYNYYVEIEHPGCPSGCLAVATSQILLHCKDSLVYHNNLYDLKEMRRAIRDSIVLTPSGPSLNSLIPVQLITYNSAIRCVAKIIYYIGIDINMQYAPSGSYESCNRDDMVDYMVHHNCILLMCGVTNGYGHSWIIDGFIKEIDFNDPDYVGNTYFHCDWGWDGSSNGYYSGDILPQLDTPFFCTATNYAAIESADLLSELL